MINMKGINMESERFECVWDALIEDPAERAVLKLQSELMINLLRFIKDNNLNQMQAASLLGVPQPRISDLKRGNFKTLSIAKLIEMNARAGFDMGLNMVASKKAA